MPRFRFEAMDSTGGARTDHVEAVNADEAMQILRGRGLFVAKLKEVSDDEDGHASSEELATESSADPDRPRPNRWVGLVFIAVGLASAVTALAGLADVTLFQVRATARADAVIVAHVSSGSNFSSYHDVLEFSAAGKSVRVESRGPFGILWGWGTGRGMGGSATREHAIGSKVPVLYPPDHPGDARLAAFQAQYAAPLFVLIPALLFTPLGVLVFRRGLKLGRN